MFSKGHLISFGTPGYWYGMRGLAMIYLVAFGSLLVQLEGLIGSNGILPAAPQFLELSRVRSFHEIPSLMMWLPYDLSAYFICIFGMVCAVLLLLDIVSPLAALGCWILYLSIVYAGQTFTSFQWDILLLEFGFLSIFICSWLAFPIRDSRLIKLLSLILEFSICFLLFKLMFSSGIIKILGGDTWLNLSALKYHFFTQPIPGPLSYYFHNLPDVCLSLMCAMTFYLELLVPLGLLYPSVLVRKTAAIQLVTLQIVIFISGNFAFFNLLTIVVCSMIIIREPLIILDRRDYSSSKKHVQNLGIIACITSLILLIPLNLKTIYDTCNLNRLLPSKLSESIQLLWYANKFYAPALKPFKLVNSYGLFARMTVERPELQIQASMDGIEWIDYEFKYKINQPSDASMQVAPYHPRLDWQMWFVAMYPNFPARDWFHNFIIRLLQNEKAVINLLKKTPFDRKPRFIRILKYNYEFEDPKVSNSGNLWKRKLVGVFLAPVNLQ